MQPHRFVTYPIYLLGGSSVLLGLGWVFAPRPWLLDKRANEALLQSSYADLFAAPGNAHLAEYLTGLYRFFGWWVVAIGMLIVVYVATTGLASRRHRRPLYVTLAVIVGVLYVLQLKFIPVSPFVWTSYGFAAMVLLSAVAARRLPDAG